MEKKAEKDEDKKLDWLIICGKCGFHSDEDINGTCYHPYNEKYSCLGFRKNNSKILGIFESKEKRCGEKARYFESQTPELIRYVENLKIANQRERIERIKREKENYEKIENVLSRNIRSALQKRYYDICSCNHITFDYRNEEGITGIVRDLLDQFDIKEKKDIQKDS